MTPVGERSGLRAGRIGGGEWKRSLRRGRGGGVFFFLTSGWKREMACCWSGRRMGLFLGCERV